MMTSKADQVFDVTKPGKAAPDATARPVIVGHGPPLQRDPMVSDSGSGAPAAEGMTPAASSTHKVIAPPNESAASSSPTQPEAPSTPAPAAEPASDDSDEPIKSSESAEVEAVIDQATKKKKNIDEEQEKADKARREHITHLVADKTYFLPIGQVTRKKKVRKSLILILVLVLLGGGGYAAYAMGYLKALKLP